MRIPAISCAVLVAAAHCASAIAQTKPAAGDYPNRVVRIVLPQPAGGGTDTVARTLASRLSEMWGQQVIVDNRAGANGIIGTEAVVKSKPDGYTLLYGFTSMLTINPSVYKALPYETLRDLSAVSQTVTNQMALVVNPYLPVRIGEGARRARPLASRRVALWLVRRGQPDAPHDRAFPARSEVEDAPRALQGRDARDHGARRRAGRAHVFTVRGCDAVREVEIACACSRQRATSAPPPSPTRRRWPSPGSRA